MSVQISARDILGFAGHRIHPGFAGIFDKVQPVLDHFGIADNPVRLAHFIAQIMVETQNFQRMNENLNFTNARRIALVWPHRFSPQGKFDPTKYVDDAEKLADVVYGGRMGNDMAGDGAKYSGHGLLQLTGKEAFSVMTTQLETYFSDKAPDLTANPELACSVEWALTVAVVFWHSKHCNAVADNEKGAVRKVTRRINGGVNGLKEREFQYQLILAKVRRLVCIDSRVRGQPAQVSCGIVP